jgi:hypothetical protein
MRIVLHRQPQSTNKNIKRKTMKKQLFPYFAALLLVSLSTTVFAQESQAAGHSSTPKWVSGNGYWVVESNIKTPLNSTIYFYTTDNVLVYKENVQGMKIRLNRTKVLMRLKTVLDQSVTAWHEQHISKENQMLVAVALKK